MKYTVEEIERLMEGITAGEWFVKDDGSKADLVGVASTNSNWFIAEEVIDRDAQFIAAAPSIIRDLIAQLRDYQEVIKDHKRVARELDEALCDEPAKQASLCDLLAYAGKLKSQLREKERDTARECAEIAKEWFGQTCQVITDDCQGKKCADCFADEIRQKYGV